MLKLTGALGAYRVIDDQTGAVVLNATSARYVHEAGSPPILTLEVQGALIDAWVMVAGELYHVTGDGHNTNLTAPDGTPVRNVRSVDVQASPVEGVAVVTLAEVAPDPGEAPAEPEAPTPEPEIPTPADVIPTDPTTGGSAAENASETSSDAAETETPTPRASRRPRG